MVAAKAEEKENNMEFKIVKEPEYPDSRLITCTKMLKDGREAISAIRIYDFYKQPYFGSFADRLDEIKKDLVEELERQIKKYGQLA